MARTQGVAVSGATGLVGAALVRVLQSAGRPVRPLVRRPAQGAEEIHFDAARGTIEADKLEGLEAVVHLAGESIAARRWSPAQKRRIHDSRVQSTELLATTLAGLARPPRVLIVASAVGFYGDRGDAVLDETAEAGQGFLARTCLAWEAASVAAEAAGIRVVRPRIGVVLSRQGGALQRMLWPFRLGLGGRLGSGRQFMSWIVLEDLLRVLLVALNDQRLSGAVNAVAPGAVSNREFTRALGRVLRRPTWIPLPALAIRLALGEMGQELLLAGARVHPARLQQVGFEFRQARIEPALLSTLAG